MAFFRSKWTRDVLMWMLSTKMMPAVGALGADLRAGADSGTVDTPWY